MIPILHVRPVSSVPVKHFQGKNGRRRVILKINGATPQLDQNLNPQDICRDNFFIYIQVHKGMVFNVSENAKKSNDTFDLRPTRRDPTPPDPMK